MTDGGLSKARLARIGEIMRCYVERGEVPGVVTVVARRGEVHAEAAGAMVASGSDPIRRDTLFRVTSMTKPATAVAAMILVEECALRLDEPVDRLLPELADRRVLKRLDGPLDDTVPANRPITVRDLLTFTPGRSAASSRRRNLPDPGRPRRLSLGPPHPRPARPDEWIRRLGTLPLMHQPGESWMYNTGADVLGVLIARASRPALRDLPARTDLRAARHERHRLQRAAPPSSTGWRPATGPTRPTGALDLVRRGRRTAVEPPAGVPVRGRRPV